MLANLIYRFTMEHTSGVLVGEIMSWNVWTKTTCFYSGTRGSTYGTTKKKTSTINFRVVVKELCNADCCLCLIVLPS